MTLHNIGLHLIGLALFIVLLLLLCLLCKVVDKAIVTPRKSSTTSRRSNTSRRQGEIPLTPLMGNGRKDSI
ncbi:unnamed protein product [Nippostrongylus brasiliensis]|uniref:Uncharacterized protein n=1 Tax=Nippostrongylus brasiliensis TaxID=27835 RepID=A0A158R158_NIPBR|nr:unnamed protein product [Nippostrongylus brasiliensis]